MDRGRSTTGKMVRGQNTIGTMVRDLRCCLFRNVKLYMVIS